MKFEDGFDPYEVDINDPDPWLALYLDQSLPMSELAKAAMLRGHRSNSRRVLLPLVKPFARLSIIIVQLLRLIIPSKAKSPKILHLLIYWGLKYFGSKETNMLILRHMHIGTQILKFIAKNTHGIEITTTKPLSPQNLEGLIDKTFTVHDLNLFNFIIEFNRQLREQHRQLEPIKNIDFTDIEPEKIKLDELPDKWHNFIDIQTAIELYTPLYALFQSDEDFWRASNSLQLDETIAIYVSTICNTQLPLSIVNNGHPTVPYSTLKSGFRLMLHGLDAENLYGFLVKLKQKNHSMV